MLQRNNKLGRVIVEAQTRPWKFLLRSWPVTWKRDPHQCGFTHFHSVAVWSTVGIYMWVYPKNCINVGIPQKDVGIPLFIASLMWTKKWSTGIDFYCVPHFQTTPLDTAFDSFSLLQCLGLSPVDGVFVWLIYTIWSMYVYIYICIYIHTHTHPNTSWGLGASSGASSALKWRPRHFAGDLRLQPPFAKRPAGAPALCRATAGLAWALRDQALRALDVAWHGLCHWQVLPSDLSNHGQCGAVTHDVLQTSRQTSETSTPGTIRNS